MTASACCAEAGSSSRYMRMRADSAPRPAARRCRTFQWESVIASRRSASAQQAEAVTVGGSSRSVLNVPDPWYGTMADFVDTLEVVERVSDELADELAALRD